MNMKIIKKLSLIHKKIVNVFFIYTFKVIYKKTINTYNNILLICISAILGIIPVCAAEMCFPQITADTP